MHSDACRLFALDERLHREADEMLSASGIGDLLSDAGFVAVGSYAMHTMTWRDLDFELYAPMDWEAHWQLGLSIARTGWCYRANCFDATRETDNPPDSGQYWGLKVTDPARPGPFSRSDHSVWKLDLWRAPREDFEAAAGEKRQLWQGVLTDETRSHILALKEAVCHDPEYRKTLLSVHIYEAVLEHEITDLLAFREWWAQRTAPGV
jgi:hypothetical protein